MEKTDSLFSLIKSLSKTEKGYFKKLNSFHVRGEKNNYMRLFDVLDRMELYDEKRLAARFKGEKFLRQLPVAKNYLYNLILKSLESYHTSDASELRSLLSRAEILYQKGLSDQALRLLRRAQSNATAQERFTYALEALHLELAYSREHYTPRMLATTLDKFRADTTIQLQQLKNIFDYEMLRASAVTIGSGMYGRHRSKVMGAIDKLLDEPLLSDTRHASSARAQHLRLNTIISGWFHKGNLEKAGEHLSILIGNLLSHPEVFRDDALRYMIAYYNMSLNCERLQQYDDALSWLEQLRALKPPHENLRVRIFELYYNALFTIYYHSGRFEDFAAVISEFDRRLRLHGKRVNVRMRGILIAQVAYMFFTIGKYSMALKWNNINLQEMGPDMREDMQNLTRVLDLFIHYELNNFDLLEYKLKSMQRYYTKLGEHALELLIIDMLKKLIGRLDAPGQQEKILTQFSKKLSEDISETEKQKLFPLFDLEAWLESKLRRRSFAEIKRGEKKKR